MGPLVIPPRRRGQTRARATQREVRMISWSSPRKFKSHHEKETSDQSDGCPLAALAASLSFGSGAVSAGPVNAPGAAPANLLNNTSTDTALETVHLRRYGHWHGAYYHPPYRDRRYGYRYPYRYYGYRYRPGYIGIWPRCFWNRWGERRCVYY